MESVNRIEIIIEMREVCRALEGLGVTGYSVTAMSPAAETDEGGERRIVPLTRSSLSRRDPPCSVVNPFAAAQA